MYTRETLAERLRLQVANVLGILDDLENPETPAPRIAAILAVFNESQACISVAKELRDAREHVRKS